MIDSSYLTLFDYEIIGWLKAKIVFEDSEREFRKKEKEEEKKFLDKKIKWIFIRIWETKKII